MFEANEQRLCGLHVVGDGSLLADGEVASATEVFNDGQCLGFGNFMTEVSNQETEQFLLKIQNCID